MGKTLLLELIQRELQAKALTDRHETCLRIGLDSAVDTRTMAENVMWALEYPSLPRRPNLVMMNHLVKVAMAALLYITRVEKLAAREIRGAS